MSILIASFAVYVCCAVCPALFDYKDFPFGIEGHLVFVSAIYFPILLSQSVMYYCLKNLLFQTKKTTIRMVLRWGLLVLSFAFLIFYSLVLIWI